MCSNGHLIEKAYGKGLPSGLAFWEKGDFYFILFWVIFFPSSQSCKKGRGGAWWLWGWITAVWWFWAGAPVSPLACGGSCATKACSCLQAFFFSCDQHCHHHQLADKSRVDSGRSGWCSADFYPVHCLEISTYGSLVLGITVPEGLTARRVAVLWADHQTCSDASPALRREYETKQNDSFLFSL